MPTRVQQFFDVQGEGERPPRRIFWTALTIRLLYLTLAHTYRIRPGNAHFDFGWEMGRIARALATGYGFADPFNGHTGPTAWTPPLYPLLLAAVFKVFGVYTAASGWVILAVNSVFGAATAPAVYRIALRTFGRGAEAGRIALWSAWLWALYPAAMQYDVRWVWDMSLTAFLFAWVIVLALELRESQQVSRWILFGSLWGLIALSNSSLLAFLPACVLWMAWPTLRAPATWRNVALAGVCCAALVSPWIVRNWYAFHAFVPMRSNFGAELYESALPENQGFPLVASLALAERDPRLLRYKRLGELEYSRQQGARAWALIDAHRGVFAINMLKRVWFFWVSVPHATENGWKGIANETGREMSHAFLSLSGLFGLALALRNRVPAAWLFVWALAVIPLLYYVVTVQARFRHPLEPLICVLGVYLFRSAERKSRPA
jgi:4-amino-4-deoxy-L-arabinose transferase-like glycosyltransferase